MKNVWKQMISLMLVSMLILSVQSSIFANMDDELHDKEWKEHFEKLKKEGFERKDIFTAMFIAKKADKEVSEILATYKKTKSWEKTAQTYGIDLEKERKKAKQRMKKFVKEHKKEIAALIVEKGEQEQVLKALEEKDVSIHQLVYVSAIAKESSVPFEEVYKKWKDGKRPHELMKEYKTSKKAVHKTKRMWYKEMKSWE